MMQMKQFEYGELPLRAMYNREEVHFVAPDVLEILRLDRKALDALEEDDKSLAVLKTETLATVNKVGLYSLILSSPYPQAKAFGSWVSSVMLPWIRRNAAAYRAQAEFIQSMAAEEERAAKEAHIALNLAAPVLQRKKLVMDFSDIHHPKAEWVTGGALLHVGTEEEGWAEKLLQPLSREQLSEVLQTAARMLSSRG